MKTFHSDLPALPIIVVLMVALMAAGAPTLLAEAPPGFEYRCPETWDDGAGGVLPLLRRSSGVWRVDDGILFTLGQGMFWRWVCAYGSDASASNASAIEAVAHWVEIPHEDGLLMLDGSCGRGDAEGLLVSPEQQAYAEATPATNVAVARLARQLLTAAEAASLPCPGSDGASSAARCQTWDMVETYSRGEVSCSWYADPSDANLAPGGYRSECLYRGGVTGEGRVDRVDASTYRRSFNNPFGVAIETTFRGNFSGRGELAGTASWETTDGSSGEMTFTAVCREAEI